MIQTAFIPCSAFSVAVNFYSRKTSSFLQTMRSDFDSVLNLILSRQLFGVIRKIARFILLGRCRTLPSFEIEAGNGKK